MLHYVHRADDPYSWLMIQVLPALLARFAVQGRVHVLHELDPAMYPAPEQLAAYARADAAALAHLYALQAPPSGPAPDQTAVAAR